VNYGWARDYTLQLINQYSIAGTKIDPVYNNQADYIARIPKLLDDAQVYVATGPKKLRATVPVISLARVRFGKNLVYTMPEDFWQMSSAGFVTFEGQAIKRFHRYHVLGDDQFVLDEPVPEPLILEYYRYPILLGADPKDNAELDNDLEVQMALPFYAAAHLVMQDNAFAYASLLNEFESRISRIQEIPQTELNTVEDRYEMDKWGDGEVCM